MKKIVLIISLIFTANIFANSEYSYTYNVESDGEKIGIYTTTAENSVENIFKYTTNISIKFSYLFIDYEYSYIEEAYVDDGKLVSLFVYEKDDGKIKKLKAKVDGNILVYNTGAKIDLSKVDYLPFNMKPKVYKDFLTHDTLVLTTFDSLEAVLYTENNTLESSLNGQFTIKSIDDEGNIEYKTLNSQGEIIYMKNELFEATLVR